MGNNRIKFLSVCVGIFVSLWIVGCVKQEKRVILPLESVEQGKNERHFTSIYDGIKHDFYVYLPDERKTETPLIIMLHAYGATAERFRSNTHMDEDANEKGYAVVYVTGASDPEDRTSSTGWNSGLRDSKKDDVGFLIALATYLQNEYQLSKDRTFAVGLSNGAFMTYRLATEASDTFSAIASVAGMMPEMIWQEKPKAANVGVLQINGTKDEVVPMKLNGSDQTSRAPAIENVIQYWAAANGLNKVEKVQISDQAEVTKFTNTKMKNMVWHVVITDGYHSWPQEQFAGFRTNELILNFFDSH